MDENKYNRLAEYETILHRALYGNYSYCTRKEFDDIMEIDSNSYTEYTINKSAFTCNRCKLNELRKVAKKYFNYKDGKERRKIG